MSGIGALYHPDGRPADAAAMTRMLHAVAHRGPDVREIWSDGALALGHVAHSTATVSRRARRLVAAADGLRAVLDGRLDNRADLEEEEVRGAEAHRVRQHGEAERQQARQRLRRDLSAHDGVGACSHGIDGSRRASGAAGGCDPDPGL